MTLGLGLAGCEGHGVEPVSLRISPENPAVLVSGSLQLSVLATYGDNTTADVTAQATWTPLDAAVATVNAVGYLTGQSVGQTTVTAAVGQVTAQTTVTVSAPPLVSISVTLANPSVLAGGTQQFMAMGTYADSSMADLTGKVTWSSSATQVATIDAAGLANTLSAGTTAIRAMLDGASDSTTLTVTAPPPCPTTFSADSVGRWWLSGPGVPLNAFSKIRVVARFRNGHGSAITFSGNQPQLWTNTAAQNGTIFVPTVKFDQLPSGTFQPNTEFSFDFTITATNIPSSHDVFVVRPQSDTLGTMSTNKAVFSSATITCTQ